MEMRGQQSSGRPGGKPNGAEFAACSPPQAVVFPTWRRRIITKLKAYRTSLAEVRVGIELQGHFRTAQQPRKESPRR